MKFNQFPQPVIKENADYTVREITNVIKKYGPRESGNDNCYSTQKHLKKELDQFCDETHFEEYQLAPKGRYINTKIIPVTAILAFVIFGVLIFLNVIPVMYANLCLLGVLAVCALLPYNKMGKKVTAHNLVATRKPRGKVEKRIVLVGNVDAAYEQSLVRRFKKKSYEKFTGFGIYMLAFSALVAAVSFFISMVNPEYNDYVKYLYFAHIITIIFLIKSLFSVDFKTISPGAIDNLTGAYSALGALRMLDMAGVDFESTEVTALITDGKEASAAGAKAYVDAHKDELGEDTRVFVVQSLAAEQPRIEKDSKKINDMVWFKNAGVNAALITAEDAKADYYHNRRDNADVLNQKAIEAGFALLLEEMLKFDEQ